MPLLSPGDQFPELTITTTDDQTFTLPDAFTGDFAVVLFYRGGLVPVLQRPAARIRTRQPGAGRPRYPRRRPVGR
jgi:peroxiredoxin